MQRGAMYLAAHALQILPHPNGGIGRFSLFRHHKRRTRGAKVRWLS